MDVTAGRTVCEKVAEALAPLLPSPLYFATMSCNPAASPLVVKAELPLTMELVPSAVLPSEKVTVPVAIDEACVRTCAVNVTAWPRSEGLTLEESATVVAAPVTVRDTSTDDGEPLDPAGVIVMLPL